MRVVLALCLLLAAACGGGGQSFSTDLMATHPFLVGSWEGFAQSRSGPTIQLAVAIQREPSDPPDVLVWGAIMTGSPCGSSVHGRLRAGGSAISLEPQSALRISFTGTIVGQDRIEGSYQVLNGGCAGDSGTIALVKVAPLVFEQEVWRYPELDVIVQFRR